MELMKDKIMFIDMDGVQGKKREPPSVCTSSAIRGFRDIGFYCGCTSGKPLWYVKDYESKIIMNDGSNAYDFIICENGGRVVVNNKEYLFPVNQSSLGMILEQFRRDFESGTLPRDLKLEEKLTIFTLRFPADEKISRAITGYLEGVVEKLGLKFEIIPHIDGVDANPVGLSKVYGMREVMDYYRIDLENTCAVGDSLNDIEILKVCGYPACPSNAHPLVMDVVKNRGGFIAAKPDGEGLLEFCKYLAEKSSRSYLGLLS